MERNNEHPVNVVIVDDDTLSAEVLARGLEDYPWVSVAATASSCSEARQAVDETDPELLFLDIELNDESAIDIIRELQEMSGGKMKIVFYTSFKKYLMQALRLDAFDFLLKPFDKEELGIIMNRFRLAKSGECASTPTPSVAISANALSKELPVALAVTNITNDRVIISADNVVFFKYDTERKIWEVVLTSMQRFILRRNTTAETILKYSNLFARTHKSYIVNISFVGMISGNECRLVPPFDKIDGIKISKIYRRGLLDRFYDI